MSHLLELEMNITECVEALAVNSCTFDRSGLEYEM